MEPFHLRTVLRVMNLTAPFGHVWVATHDDPNSLNKERYGVTDGYRFYLVPDNSNLLGESGVMAA